MTATLSTFTPGEPAKQLGVREIEVRRAIARGKLKAAKPRPEAEWLVTDNTAERYVEAGMPELSEPHIFDTGSYGLDPAESRKAEQLVTEITQAANRDKVVLAEPQIKELAAVELKKSNGRTTLDRELRATPEITAALRKPVPKSILPGAQPSRFENWGQCYLAAKLWDAIPQVVRDRATGLGVRGIDSLYAGPVEYREITAAALQFVTSKSLFFSSRVMVNREKLGWVTFTVYYNLPHTTIMAASYNENTARLIELAF